MPKNSPSAKADMASASTKSPHRTKTEKLSKPGFFALYVALMKPKIISLLLITTVGAMMVAAGGMPPLTLLFWTIVGGTLSAGGANALNHYFDRDIDDLMYRTKRRPVPVGWVKPRTAIIFGIVLTILAFIVFYTQVNPLSAALSLFGGLYYIVIYTLWLKRRTHYNVTIGGVAGAIPTLVGWAAVTGGLDPMAWALFAIVFLWTPPHTWALTLVVERDYARVDVPMLPVVVGPEETHRQIIIYSWVFLASTLILFPLRLMGWLYFIPALLLGVKFMLDAYQVRKEGTRAAALSLYKYSLLHLALLFAAMVIDVRWQFLL